MDASNLDTISIIRDSKLESLRPLWLNRKIKPNRGQINKLMYRICSHVRKEPVLPSKPIRNEYTLRDIWAKADGYFVSSKAKFQAWSRPPRYLFRVSSTLVGYFSGSGSKRRPVRVARDGCYARIRKNYIPHLAILEYCCRSEERCKDIPHKTKQTHLDRKTR